VRYSLIYNGIIYDANFRRGKMNKLFVDKTIEINAPAAVPLLLKGM
jgi:hypothetical protein